MVFAAQCVGAGRGRAASAMMMLAGLLVGGCANAGGGHDSPRRVIEPQRLYERARGSFDRALLYKPGRDAAGPVDPVLAPLIVQQVSAVDGEAHPPGIGLVYVDRSGSVRVDAALPVVYAEASTGFIAGALRHRHRFAWCHETALDRKRFEVVCRGIRVTYDAEGYPLVWEVLDPSWVTDVVYAAHEVESLAADRFGPPFPGRRYSVERRAGRGAVVPLVLDDGPVPMGPYVYLGAGGRDIVSLRCRCMSSKVDTFAAEVEYEVLPMSELGGVAEVLEPDFGAIETRLRWPDGID